jgi:hypothetical protein
MADYGEYVLIERGVDKGLEGLGGMGSVGGGHGARLIRARSREEVMKMLLAARAHIGTKNSTHQMSKYIFRRRTDGTWL